MRNLIRRYPFTSYYVLAFAIVSLVVTWQMAYATAWLKSHGSAFDFNGTLLKGLSDFYHGHSYYANLVSIGWIALHRNAMYWSVFVFGGAPTISALIISAIGWGTDGLKRLLSRLKAWPSRAFRRDALIAYGVIAGFFFLYALVSIAIIAKYSGSGVVSRAIGVWGLPWYLFPLTFLIGGFIDEGATQEELGWRGFALPTLLDGSWSPLLVALGLGFLWWFWHFPREVPDLIAGHYAGGAPIAWGEFIIGQSMFLSLVVAESVVMTFFFFRTGGSVIPSIMLHGWSNFINKDLSTYSIVPRLFPNADVRFDLFVAAAILLVVVYGPSLGRNRYEILRAGES
jgi:hypothetical protein